MSTTGNVCDKFPTTTQYIAGHVGHPLAVQQERRRHRLRAEVDDTEFRLTGKLANDGAEQRLAVNRCAKVTHVPAKNGVEVGELLFAAPDDREPVLLSLSDLTAQLGREVRQQRFGSVRQGKPQMDLARQPVAERWVFNSSLLPQLHIAHLHVIG